jgi:cyclopropane fatty-acyl-phospholipid synthase-like methyltransferase
MLDAKRIVADGYDEIADRHAAWASHTRAQERERYIALLMELLPAGAALLDLGCGAGVPTTRALAARFRVTAVDLSARQVALARTNVPGATVLHGDMTQVELAPGSFDAVAAFYSIIHVPRDEHAALLKRVASWLRPEGLSVATLMASDTDDGYEPDWLGAPMYWSGYDEQTTSRLLHAADFSIQRAQIETADEDGKPVSFLWVVARRPAAAF